jgi:hypothetical protein
VEATGDLHRSWVTELERRHPGSVRMFTPSETKAARMQLGSGPFYTDDRNCAALTYLARQGRGRRYGEESAVDALRAAVRHRRGLVIDRKISPAAVTCAVECSVPRSVGPGRPRSILTGGLTDGISGTGVCGRVRGRPPSPDLRTRPRAVVAIVARYGADADLLRCHTYYTCT